MYCPNCGVMNPEGAATCRICGADLAPPSPERPRFWISRRKKAQKESEEKAERIRKELGIQPPVAAIPRAQQYPPPKVSEPEPEPEQPARTAPELTREDRTKIVMDSCPICGRPKDESENLCEYCKEEEAAELAEGGESASSDGMWASQSTDMDLAKLGGIAIIIAGFLGIAYGTITISEIVNESIPGTVVCFTGLMTVFGMAAIAGGFQALERKNAMYAILGGVFGILSVGFYIGAVLSLIGIALVYVSYEDFQVRELNLKLEK